MSGREESSPSLSERSITSRATRDGVLGIAVDRRNRGRRRNG
jgi:hypothetical protein